MAKPDFAQQVIEQAQSAGLEALAALKAQGIDAAKEGAEALKKFTLDMSRLTAKWATGAMTDLDDGRACERYASALEFTLVAIAKEQARKALSELLTRSLNFLAAITGAVMGAIK